MSDLSEALTSVQRICAKDPRDWSANRHDAFIYGVFVGWDADRYRQVAERHSWDDAFVTRLDGLHDALTGFLSDPGSTS